MATESPSKRARHNRMIAIAAGAITVIAIVLGFAGDFLGLPWHWMRPAAELLLLAELVGLVVLERHQLFEPVHDKVDDVKSIVTDVRQALGLLTERIGDAGQVEMHSNPADFTRAVTRLVDDALARDQDTPQILRTALLSGAVFPQDDRDVAAEIQDTIRAMKSVLRTQQTPSNSKARLWSTRGVWTLATAYAFDSALEFFRAHYFEAKPINFELKIQTRPHIEALLSPGVVTDRDAAVVYANSTGDQRWGFVFHGRQYVALFAGWFDDVWTSIPDTHLVYSRNGLNQQALDRIRKELEAIESAQAIQTG